METCKTLSPNEDVARGSLLVTKAWRAAGRHYPYSKTWAQGRLCRSGQGCPRRRIVLLFCLALLVGAFLTPLLSSSLFNAPLRYLKVAWHGTPDYFNCSTENLVSFEPQGRLGNVICEYAYLLRVQSLYSMPAALHLDVWFQLSGCFPSLSLKPISYDCLDEIAGSTALIKEKEPDFEKGERGRWLLTGTPCNLLDFWPQRNVWRNDLRFSHDLQDDALRRRAALTLAWRKEGANGYTENQTVVTAVGVHVRRSDITYVLSKYNYGDLLPPQYYLEAFNYYRRRFSHVLIFVITEPSERPWCYHHLQAGSDDVIVVDDGSTDEQDLALLSSFDHIVYSHGTFGLWGILLSNAKTVTYPARDGHPELTRYSHHSELDNLKTNWSGMEFNTISFTRRQY